MISTDRHSLSKTGGMAIMLSYSPPSTLHPQVYAIAFSAGQNGLKADKVDRETIK